MELVVIPAHNEEATVGRVIRDVLRTYPVDLLVVDDGSTDETAREAARCGARVLQLQQRTGYGGAVISGFGEAIRHGYEYLATLDADGQHEAEYLQEFLAKARDWDVVSGSRYHPSSPVRGVAPPDRVRINREITEQINRFSGWNLTDAFCGMKAYRVDALRRLHLDEKGYAFPIQFWVRAARAGLSVTEIPVGNVYFPNQQRSFGEGLDDPQRRQSYYLEVLQAELRAPVLPSRPLR